MKTFSTVNETCPDMMASCSFPENTKNNDLYLVRRRDLAKTNLITSASYLDTNSRVKCSMHSSPNIVTAHRVYPLHRESIKTASSASPTGVQSVRPTWFEDTTPRDTTSQQSLDPPKEQSQPLHGLKLVIKEEVLPPTDQPQFQSLELLVGRGLLASDTWKCKRAQVSLKATVDVPMLGTIIEENGDGLLEDSHMPVRWPLHIDGAVR